MTRMFTHKFPIKMNFKNKILIMFVIILFALIMETTAIIYLVARLDEAVSKAGQKRRLLAIAKAERLNSVSLQNDFAKTEKFFPALEKVFPTENNIYDTIGRLKSLGESAGNQISARITSGAIMADENGFDYVFFEASLSGNYGTLRNFLRELNKAPFLVKIDSFNISGVPSVNNQSNVNLSGKIFVEK